LRKYSTRILAIAVRSLSFAVLAAQAKRSIERLFQQEVGMTFGRWRQQLRLMHAMRLLAEGAKVTYAALESGYSTPSAFISMFRKTLGIAPKSYFNQT
jgi:AraC-like DNA-binding protein